MNISKINPRKDFDLDNKAAKLYAQLNSIIHELNSKEIPDEVIKFINNEIEKINTTPEDEKALRKQLKKSQSGILKELEKKLKIVTKNQYRNTWLAIGMAAFGIPIGAAVGASLGNMALLSAGLPIGMAIGIGIGTSMDQTAKNEGRQLKVDIKH
jgi:hypothetical protein